MTMVMFKFAKKEPLLSLVVGSNPPEYIFFLFSDSRHLVIHYHKLRELKLGNHFIIINREIQCNLQFKFFVDLTEKSIKRQLLS